jgi:hypothetical protein
MINLHNFIIIYIVQQTSVDIYLFRAGIDKSKQFLYVKVVYILKHKTVLLYVDNRSTARRFSYILRAVLDIVLNRSADIEGLYWKKCVVLYFPPPNSMYECCNWSIVSV